MNAPVESMRPRDRSEAASRLESQVIVGRLRQCVVEAGQRLVRMAFSSIIRESHDYGLVLTDGQGRMLAEVDATPMQLATMPGYVRGIQRALHERKDEPQPGDVFIHNDPYYGATHASDVGIAIPVFDDGELIAWCVSAAHQLDIGSHKPGAMSADAVDVYAEGLRMCALRVFREDERVDDIWRFIECNVRLPTLVIGDLEATVSACRLCVRRFRELWRQFGAEKVRAAGQWLENYTEAVTRARISSLPSGVYRAEGILEGFLDSSEPGHRELKVAITLTVSGSHLSVDMQGSSSQAVGCAINMPFEGSVVAAVLIALRTMLLDELEYGYVPMNDGFRRCVTVTAPGGTWVNPRFPAATNSRNMGLMVVSDTLIRALAQAAPARCCAGTGPLPITAFVGSRSDGQPWGHVEICAGCFGATVNRDGLDAIDSLVANCRNVPVEDTETHVPLRTLRSELRGHPAAGRFRGGISTIHETLLLTDARISAEMQGMKYSSWGIDGGASGVTLKSELIEPGGKSAVPFPPMFSGRPAAAGSIFRVESGGAGGYGDPLEREPRQVLEDVLDELVTLDEAAAQYGVVIDPSGPGVDWPRTQALRAKRRESSGEH